MHPTNEELVPLDQMLTGRSSGEPVWRWTFVWPQGLHPRVPKCGR